MPPAAWNKNQISCFLRERDSRPIFLQWGNCARLMRLPDPSPVLDKNRAPMGPDVLSNAVAGVWRKAPIAFPDSSSVLDKFQSAIRERKLNATFVLKLFGQNPRYPGKIPRYPARKFVFPRFRGTYPHPFTRKTPVWVCASFSCPMNPGDSHPHT